jgi:hypothetical protein
MLVIFLVVLISGCGPKHFGYQLHADSNKEAKDFALIVHAVNDFAVVVYSINGKSTDGIIRTNSQIPTYLEVVPGQYEFGVGLKKGYGACGRVDVFYQQPVKVNAELEAGKVYLMQRRSQFDAAILCDRMSNSINVEFYLSELPALPYEDVRGSFIEIDLSDLPEF